MTIKAFLKLKFECNWCRVEVCDEIANVDFHPDLIADWALQLGFLTVYPSDDKFKLSNDEHVTGDVICQSCWGRLHDGITVSPPLIRYENLNEG